MAELVERFHAEYGRRYGNRFPYMPVEGVSYRVELLVPAEKVEYSAAGADGDAEVAPETTVELRHLEEGPVQAGCYSREALPVGARVHGPAVIREPLSTTLVGPGQVARIGRFEEIVIAPS
jgi:N-methylhydantoinase A